MVEMSCRCASTTSTSMGSSGYKGSGMLPDPSRICDCFITPKGVYNGFPCAPSYESKIFAMEQAEALRIAKDNDICCNLVVKTGAPVGTLALPQELPIGSRAIAEGKELPAAFVSQRGAADASLKTMMKTYAASSRSMAPQFQKDFDLRVGRVAGSAIAVTDNGCAVQNFGQMGPTFRMGWKLASCGNIPSTIGWSFGSAVCPVPVSGCAGVTAITNFESSGDTFVGGIYWVSYDLTWDAVAGASYNLTSSIGTDEFVFTSDTSATITVLSDSNFDQPRVITLTVTTECGFTTATVTNTPPPCFLAGSLIAMADGSVKVIEAVQVGDLMVGAFGETNEVLALHRPLLGKCEMLRINNEHSTSIHHPHIGANKAFYSGNPDRIWKGTYGRSHKVIDGEGNLVDRMLHGVKPQRIIQLEVGAELKTVEGSRVVSNLEVYSMPEDTQLYNLVVGGSHTYHVNGYAVTGWPREDDFNYDTWSPIV